MATDFFQRQDHARRQTTRLLVMLGGGLIVVVAAVALVSWLVTPPAAGCAPRIGQIGPDKLEQVVFEVMHELEKRGVL